MKKLDAKISQFAVQNRHKIGPKKAKTEKKLSKNFPIYWSKIFLSKIIKNEKKSSKNFPICRSKQ